MAIQTTAVSGYDKAAWDLLTRYALRPQLFFDRLATVRATKQAHPGATVDFTFTDDLAVNVTELTETGDATESTFADSSVQVVLKEYGHVVKGTAKLRGTGFIPLDPVIANLVGYNAGLSLDTLARDVLVAGTNVTYGGAATSRVTVAAAHTLAASNIRKTVAQLRNANVMAFGDKFAGYINPDTSVDLRTETGAAGWLDVHNYSKPEERWNGEVGTFEGVRFMEASRCPVLANAGVTSTVEVYQTLIVGQEAMAKAFSKTESGELPSVRPSTVTDNLGRVRGMGWYWLGGYKILREAAVRRIEHSSSLAVNV